jgi:hypothetical protein
MAYRRYWEVIANTWRNRTNALESYFLLVLSSEFYPLFRGHSCECSIRIDIYTGLMYCTNGHDTMTVMLCILLRQS